MNSLLWLCRDFSRCTFFFEIDSRIVYITYKKCISKSVGEKGVGALPLSTKEWSVERPHVLVVACSDGRLQEQIDEFLSTQLDITQYDRLYLPGGPGALAGNGLEDDRADRHRQECRFLVEAHGITDVILIFHSGSADGPEEAMCADYVRKLPDLTTAQLRARQEADVPELLHLVFGEPPELRVRVYRAEVTPEGPVQFVELAKR